MSFRYSEHIHGVLEASQLSLDKYLRLWPSSTRAPWHTKYGMAKLEVSLVSCLAPQGKQTHNDIKPENILLQHGITLHGLPGDSRSTRAMIACKAESSSWRSSCCAGLKIAPGCLQARQSGGSWCQVKLADFGLAQWSVERQRDAALASDCSCTLELSLGLCWSKELMAYSLWCLGLAEPPAS